MIPYDYPMLIQELPHDYPMIFAAFPVIFDVFPRWPSHCLSWSESDAKVAAFLVAVA